MIRWQAPERDAGCFTLLVSSSEGPGMTPQVAPPPDAPLDPASIAVTDPDLVPNLDELITEDDVPVDSIFAEKQQRLLTEPLYSSWPGPGVGRCFLALAN